MTSELYRDSVSWHEAGVPSAVRWDERIIVGSSVFEAARDRRSGAARILLVGHSCDPDLARIAMLLADTGADVHAVLVDRIGRQPSMTFPQSGDRAQYDVGYCRGFRPGQFVHFHYDRTVRRADDWRAVEPDLLDHATEQADSVLWGWLARVEVARWVNSPWQLRTAENKLIQLTSAQHAGLTIPATLVTSRIDELRQFARGCAAGVVHKSLSSPILSSRDRQRSFLYTSVITPDDIALPDYPCLFQQRLRPRVEHRVTVIGERTFAASLARAADDAADWRRAANDHPRFDHHRLDEPLVSAIRQLMRTLEIQVGAVDLIDTGEETYFLEINPSAALLWLERTLGMHLCQSVTNLILHGR
ncbi:hypothetical protein [Nocardia caishijiensis]|uniref:RimK-like ATP-grasp domain-containing protein n=1 Tax=Nocardia caishijiensis TaxID=184756 RepID=A0ABQ6YII9_9NOCA|nr:hypothetical protein [Nocardia caishijiensis]KAF0845266.1 RimK-like ATP-grasp domain-containing protein [Nocardia caishijiensis]